MKKVLITGANKGIGFETARQLLKHGFYVFIGSRNLENGNAAVEKLKADGLQDVEAIQLDALPVNLLLKSTTRKPAKLRGRINSYSQLL